MNLPEKTAVALASILSAALLLLAGCTLSGADLSQSADYQRFEQSHFGFFSARRSYPFVEELGVHWERPHPGPFIWGEIEKDPGTYDWSAVDKYVTDAQNNGVLLVATIWPYANWDEQQCHEKLPDTRRLFSILGDYRAKPCDTEAYKRFVKALVERYDGNSTASMPGLKYPIKYWEVINEPEMGGSGTFFKGDPQTADYLEVLQTTHDAIKATDPQAKVLNGGIASLFPLERPFWETVLGGPGAGDVDILTIHSITLGTDLQLPSLNALMNQLALDQPVWVTEIQYARSKRFPLPGQAPGQPAPAGDEEEEVPETVNTAPAADYGDAVTLASSLSNLTQDEWSEVLVHSFVEAFGRGASKLFYIGLDNATPTEETSLLVSCQVKPGASRNDPFDPVACQRQKPFYAYKTLVDKIDYFDSVQKLGEGQFRFSIGGRSVYVLWGSLPLPGEIKGKVRVTDVYGQESEAQAENLSLTDSPVYVEISG
ncbi:MAG: hypothetical protein ACYC6Z_06340 [Thermoleophilia bacterium]